MYVLDSTMNYSKDTTDSLGPAEQLLLLCIPLRFEGLQENHNVGPAPPNIKATT